MAQAGGRTTSGVTARFEPRRLLVASPLTPATRAALADLPSVAYLPTLSTADAEALRTVLEELRPDTLIVGSNAVDGPTLRRWAYAARAHGEGGALLIIRRGTSLAAIDTETAAELGIAVRNTPEVNARYLARYVVDELFADHDPTAGPRDVGLVGAGAINSAVARLLVDAGHHVLVHTPGLAARGRARWGPWLAAADLTGAAAGGQVRLATDLTSVFAGAERLAIAVPLTDAGPHPTDGMIRARHLKTFAGHRIVSVSEPGIFSPGGVREAYARRDVSVLMDNAMTLFAPVRRDIAERFGDVEQLRPGFVLQSKAMHVPGCGEDLDHAVLAAAGAAELTDAATHPVAAPPPVGGLGPVLVVGAGIVGLTVALALRDAGWSEVDVVDAAPADRTVPTSQGTTYAGTDGRHLSLTETVPHANADRRDVLRRTVAEGGWGGYRPPPGPPGPPGGAGAARAAAADPTELSAAEHQWAGAFARLADRPGLHALITDEVIAMNRLGLRGWEAIFDRHPEVLDGVRLDHRIPRVYLTAADLESGRQLQERVNRYTRELSDDDLRDRWPALAPRDSGAIAGAIEVDGYALNIHRLADNLAAELGRAGVRVRHGTRVVRIEPTGAPAPFVGDPAAPGPEPRDQRSGLVRRPGLDVELSDGSVGTVAAAVLTVGGRDLVRVGPTGATGPSRPAHGPGTVQSVLGSSITLPNPGILHALKIHAPDPVGVVNVTLSPDGTVIHASGGFCWLGLTGTAPDDATVAAVTAGLEAIIARVFPRLAAADGTLPVLDRRICERPMTADGAPVLERVGGPDGRLVIAGGTGAGGTVQAPAVARLVSTLLAGQVGCAHVSMRPDRVALGSGPTP